MRAERVALIPRCAERESAWLPADEECWSAYLTDDEPPEIAFYRARCVSGSSARTEIVDDRVVLPGRRAASLVWDVHHKEPLYVAV